MSLKALMMRMQDYSLTQHLCRPLLQRGEQGLQHVQLSLPNQLVASIEPASPRHEEEASKAGVRLARALPQGQVHVDVDVEALRLHTLHRQHRLQ